MKIFLFPPAGSAATFAPPKVNVGSGPECTDEPLCAASAGMAAALAADVSSARGACCETCGAAGASRAGAGALAAPLLCECGKAALNASCASNAVAGGTLTDCVSNRAAVAGADTESSRISRRSSSLPAGPGATGAALATAGTGHAGAGFTSVGAAGRGAGTNGGVIAAGCVEAASFVGGTALGPTAPLATGFGGCAAGSAAGITAAAAGFVGSPLRSSPRATRSVPLACSMLMGLVRTRLAPMRNAFATPA